MAEFQWSRDKIITLIECIEAHPNIWNSALKAYRDKHLKRQSFLVIAEKIGCTTQELSRKFHNLRCQFNAELRKLNKKKSGDEDGTKKSTWEYFEGLKFMIGNSSFVRTGSSQHTPPAQNIMKDTEEAETNEETTSQDAELQSTSSVPATATTEPKKRKSNITAGFNEKYLEMLNYVVGELRAPKDEFDVFGEFVASEIRLMHSNQKRRRLKRVIQRAIYEIGEDDDVERLFSEYTIHSNSGSRSVSTGEHAQIPHS